MGPNDVFALALVCGTVIAIGVLIVIAFRREKPSKNRQLDTAILERLNRIEQAMDAISIEVERVSESQRFVTKVMADRGAERLPAQTRRE